jgi:hypothetical protein
MNQFVYLGLIWLGMLSSIPTFFMPENAYRKQHRCILIILVAVVVVESYGTYTSLNGIKNAWAYNIVFVYLETLLFLYFFSLVLNNLKFTGIMRILSAIFILWGIINTLYFQEFDLFQSYSFIFGSMLIIGCCTYFFYLLFDDESILKNQSLKSFPPFWIITFTFFFYACSFLFFASIRLMNESNFGLLGQILNLIKVLGVLMYLVMGLAFYAPLAFKETGK